MVRVLFVGYGDQTPTKESDEEIDSVNIKYNSKEQKYLIEGSMPTFYDYHIVFLNNPVYLVIPEANTYENVKLMNTYANKKEEIKILVENGNILVTTLNGKYEHNYLGSKSDNYGWNPYPFDIENKNGSHLIIEDSEFSQILSKDIFQWSAHLKYKTISNIRVLARNNPGFPISFIYEVNKGKMMFLPWYESTYQKELLRLVLDNIKKKIINKEQIVGTLTPQWIDKDKYNLMNEVDLIKKRNLIEDQLNLANKSKRILYESGRELSKSIHFVMSFFSLENLSYSEDEGLHDISFDEDKKYIVEVKGISGFASIKDLRELLDWYTREKGKDETKQVKGIFILNHYKDKDIEDRAEPFSQAAIEMAESNNFLLVTTFELYNLFKDFKNGNLTKKDILVLFNKKGLLKYQGKSTSIQIN